MADEAHEWTDDQIEALSKRFEGVYSQAAKEMREKLDTYMADYEERNEGWKRAVRDGEATESEYREWRRAQATRRRYLSDMTDTLARDATRANQRAIEMVNDAIPTVYAENANRAAYEVESGLGWDTHSFDLYDQDTVRNMMRLGDEGQILHEVIPSGTPNVPWQSLRVRFDEAKDVRWNRQKYNALLTQSILQGESIPATAKRLSKALNMGKGMATRAARTGMTAAENAGRTDSYHRAKSIGIELEQQWMATLDERTRHSHRQLDGVHVPVGEKFPNGLEFPADPKGAGEEIWNCRCTLVAWFPGIEQYDPKRWSKLPEGMTYEQWKGQKEADADRIDGNPDTLAGVVRGAPMTFDEANELRGNPNYNIAEITGDRYMEANKRVSDYARLHGYDDSDELRRLREERDRAMREYHTAMRDQSGYRTNCQTCVVANEARRRGYDVEATKRTRGSANERLAYDTNLAWIDPSTGEHPEYIRYSGVGELDAVGNPIPTRRRYERWLLDGDVLEEGARYTIEFEWTGRSHNGHIVCLERTGEGVRMYDPQNGRSYNDDGIREYLGRVKYKRTYRGNEFSVAPSLLKVSDYDFDTEICDQILRGRQ